MTGRTYYDRISIETGGERVTVHRLATLAAQGFTTTTTAPSVLRDDAVRMGVAVAGLLVTAPDGEMCHRALAASIPGDFEETLALTREMRDADYAPIERVRRPAYAPTDGTVGLTDREAARDFLGFLGILGVSVTLHP